MNFKLISLGVVLTALLFSTTTQATEYIYRDLMANTLPTKKCDSKETATKNAEKPYKIKMYTKKFCQTQGYGWHVDAIKDSGELTCNECSDQQGLQKCYIKDITVTCKRIKPGSVGMLPGKS